MSRSPFRRLLQHRERFVVRTWLHAPVAAFLAVNILATAFAADRVLALYGTHVRMHGLGTVADWVVMYAAVAHLARSGRDKMLIAASLFAPSLRVLASELIQVSGRDLAYASASRWREAASAFERARLLAPYDIKYAGDEASARSTGDVAARGAALGLGDDVIRIDPHNPRAHIIRATVRQASTPRFARPLGASVPSVPLRIVSGTR